MALLNFPLGRRAREQREKILTLENQNLALKNARAEIRARERIFSKILSGREAVGSMSSELYQIFPSASKSAGALSTYRAFTSSSNETLRRLSRIAAFESPTGAAMIDRLVDIVVGSGLRLQAEPMWDMIAQSLPQLDVASNKELQRAWRKNIEQRYKLWAKSLQPSYNDEWNLYQIDRQCFKYLLVDGEYFLLLRYTATGRRNGLTLQIIPPENVQGGEGKQAGDNTVVNGIEYDATGAAVAYHVMDDGTGQTKRIPRFGPKSQRIFMLHNYLKTSEKQRRGVPYLSNVIHELTKLGDYEVLEIQAAIVNALFAVWFGGPEDEDGTPVMPGRGGRLRTEEQTAETDDPLVRFISDAEKIDFAHGGIVLDGLPRGTKPYSFDTKRPNAGFDNFFQAVKKNIAAAKGQPLAVVDLAFNNSYSGARGELLMFWMHVDQLTENHGWDFEDDIYEMWTWGEVYRGNVKAPGFDDDELLRKAYCNARWIGNQQPDIDPLKSVTAAILEQKYGYRTGHQICAERGGGDYEENLVIVAQELALVAAANEPMKGLQDSQNQGGGGGGGGFQNDSGGGGGNQKDSGGPPGGGSD
jgi:lambda family phage portal protein